MLRRLGSHLSFANVTSALALFVALGGTAYAVNTVGSDDIIDNSVRSIDLRNDDVRGADVLNGSLNDEDIAQRSFVSFVGNIGTVPGNSCRYREVTGINAQGDHLLLTPNYETAHDHLSYSVEYESQSDSASIKACNLTADQVSDGNTKFNLLVIDAQ